ncbi:MAG TPA: class I SAM-dependent methyltransferase [Gemmatimonadales bacterium]|nr:class I SAM-dependent methyltransferase [Gemmatimonadales bacterium]
MTPPGPPAPREFYEAEYHFDEDVEHPNLERVWRALRPLQPLTGTAFLDLGSGVGWGARLSLARGGGKLAVGLDFSRRALTLAHRTTPGARWVQGDGTSLPFRDRAFDRVFSFGSLEHFPDLHRGLHEAFRVLRPGGLAVVVVPNFYVRTQQPLEFRATRGGWERVLRAAGFEVVDVRTDSGPAILKNFRPGRILLRLLLRLVSLVPPLRYQFVFVLRKP